MTVTLTLAGDRAPLGTLPWGRRYVAGAAGALPGRLRDQPVHGPGHPARPGWPRWRSGSTWSATLRAPRRRVDVIEPAGRRPGHGLRDEPRPRPHRRQPGPRVALSHMRFPQRRIGDRDRAAPGSSMRASRPRPSDGPASAHISRRATPSRSPASSSSGYGPRTEEQALKHLADRLRHRGSRPADHASRDVPPRPGVLPARRRRRRSSARRRSTRRAPRACWAWCRTRSCSARRRRSRSAPTRSWSAAPS